MMKLLHIFILLTVAVSLFGQQKSRNIYKSKSEENDVSDSLFRRQSKTIQYIIFGNFMKDDPDGKHNAMYKLDLSNNSLSTAPYYSFWSTNDYSKKQMDFNKQITELTKVKKAMTILDSIPMYVFVTNDNLQVIGCPDCKDGGGIYLEIQFNNVKKIFVLPLNMQENQTAIKKYAELTKRIINELNY